MARSRAELPPPSGRSPGCASRGLPSPRRPDEGREVGEGRACCWLPTKSSLQPTASLAGRQNGFISVRLHVSGSPRSGRVSWSPYRRSVGGPFAWCGIPRGHVHGIRAGSPDCCATACANAPAGLRGLLKASRPADTGTAGKAKPAIPYTVRLSQRTPLRITIQLPHQQTQLPPSARRQAEESPSSPASGIPTPSGRAQSLKTCVRSLGSCPVT